MANRRGAGRGTGKGYRNLRGFPRDPTIHSQSARGMKQPQKIKQFAMRPNVVMSDINKMRLLNMKAPDRTGMELSGTDIYAPNLDSFKKDWKWEFDGGYAHSYKIEPITEESVNNFKIIFYRKKSPYSFFWKRGGERIYKNSSNETAKAFLKKFREQPIEPIEPYPISSVERNMFMGHLNEAIKIANPKDKAKLLKKAQRMGEITPYTNWSGD